jgi:ferredoxin
MDTTQAPVTIRKVIYLSFPPRSASRAVVCNLSRDFNICFSIIKASITPRQEGFMILEVTGEESAYEQGVAYLKEQGVQVDLAAQKISRDEESCIHCGLCTALCPTGALAVEHEGRAVRFDVELCTACGMCTRVCPVRAMAADMDLSLIP